MILVGVIYFEELLLNVKGVFQDKGHPWVFLQLLEEPHEEPQPLYHHLLGVDHHF